MEDLKSILELVKDEHLPKSLLESLRDKMVHLHTMYQLELADVEKKSATFFLEKKVTMPDATDVSVKRLWKGSEAGLKEIELNRFIKALSQEIRSLRDRLYQIY